MIPSFQKISELQGAQPPAAAQSVDVLAYATPGDLLGMVMHFKRIATNPGTWTGTGTIVPPAANRGDGAILTVLTTSAGAPAVGQVLTVTGGFSCIITKFVSGTSWLVNVDQVVVGAAITGAPSGAYVRSADRFLPNGSTDSTLGGYWILTNNIISPEMFGAKRDNSTDDYLAIQSAINLLDLNVTAADLQISSLACAFNPGIYKCTVGLFSRKGAKYFVPASSDAGAQAGATCSIAFPNTLPAATPWGWKIPDDFGNTCTFENINLIYGTGAILAANLCAPVHGWTIASNVRMKCCSALGWPGNGWHLNGASDGNGFNGNIGFVDGFFIDRCVATNCGYNGFFAYGADDNIGTFNMCSAVQCRQWGFKDISFLGNMLLNCHTSTNADSFLFFSQCTFGGNTYQVHPITNLQNSDFALTLPALVPPCNVNWTGNATLAGTALSVNTTSSGTDSIGQLITGTLPWAGVGTFAGTSFTNNGTTSGALAIGSALTAPASSWSGTAAIAGTALTRSTTVSGALAIGQTILGAGIASGTMIVSGTDPNWVVNNSQTITLEAMTASNTWSGTADISGTTLTIHSTTSGALAIGQTIKIVGWINVTGQIVGTTLIPGNAGPGIATGQTVFSASVSAGTIITAAAPGSNWTVNNSQNIGPEPMTTGLIAGTVITAGSGMSWTINNAQNIATVAMTAGLAPGTVIVSGTDPNWVVNTTQTIGPQVMAGTLSVLPNTVIVSGSHPNWVVNNSQAIGPITMAGAGGTVWDFEQGGTSVPGVTAWSSSNPYQSGGSYQTGSLLIKPYAEADQPSAYITGRVLDTGDLIGALPYLGAPINFLDSGFQFGWNNAQGGLENISVLFGSGAASRSALGSITAFAAFGGSVSGTWLWEIDSAQSSLRLTTATTSGGLRITPPGTVASAQTFGLGANPRGMMATNFFGLNYWDGASGHLTEGMALTAKASAPNLAIPQALGWFCFASGASVTGSGLLGWQTTVAGSPGTQLPLYGAQIPVYGPSIVSALPAGVQGARAMVTDTTLTVAVSFGVSIVGTGGGGNIAPVYHDGTVWRVG